MEGWIKLHRSILTWEWYSDINVRVLFIHLLLKANHAPNRWQGIEIQAGQLVTSLSKLEQETGLSQKKIRNALKKLEKTGELGTQKGRAYTLITICNYERYQVGMAEEGTPEGTQRAHEGHTKGTQRATNKNDKNEKNEKNIESVSPSPPLREKKKFTPPLFDEVKAYATTRGRTDLAKSFFDYYNAGDWKDKDGKAVKNWKQKFITWENYNPKVEAQHNKQNQLDLTGRW